MTARLFCEGSVRDKQIAQESSDHKDGRTKPETMPLDNGSAARSIESSGFSGLSVYL